MGVCSFVILFVRDLRCVLLLYIRAFVVDIFLSASIIPRSQAQVGIRRVWAVLSLRLSLCTRIGEMKRVSRRGCASTRKSMRPRKRGQLLPQRLRPLCDVSGKRH